MVVSINRMNVVGMLRKYAPKSSKSKLEVRKLNSKPISKLSLHLLLAPLVILNQSDKRKYIY